MTFYQGQKVRQLTTGKLLTIHIPHFKDDMYITLEDGKLHYGAELEPIGQRPLIHTPSPDDVERVIYSGPATIVFWKDGTKTVVKCSKDEAFDPAIAILWCFLKKYFGSTSAAKEWLASVTEDWYDQQSLLTVEDFVRQIHEVFHGKKTD